MNAGKQARLPLFTTRSDFYNSSARRGRLVSWMEMNKLWHAGCACTSVIQPLQEVMMD